MALLARGPGAKEMVLVYRGMCICKNATILLHVALLFAMG